MNEAESASIHTAYHLTISGLAVMTVEPNAQGLMVITTACRVNVAGARLICARPALRSRELGWVHSRPTATKACRGHAWLPPPSKGSLPLYTLSP